MGVIMTKQEARDFVRGEKRKLDTQTVKKYSREIFKRLKALPEFVRADDILTYVSYNQEADTYEFISDCLSLGKNVYVPKVTGGQMKFLRILSLGELVPGAYGIMEPVSDSSLCWLPSGKYTFMVMPGLAFDAEHHRAGYGGGFYDRFLESNTEVYKAAVGFDFQIVENLESEPFDICPDVIITQSGIY